MSGKKHEREYLDLMRELGLRVTAVTKTGSGRLRIQVLAQNGATRPFFVSEHGGDWRAVKNNVAEFKRFADENPPPAMNTAMSKAFEMTPRDRESIGALAAALSITEPIPSPAPISAPVAPPAALAAPIESKTMNTPQKSAVVIQRLDRKEFHALTKWVVANVPQGREITLTSLAREATKALDVHIAESSLKDALELEEIKLAEPVARKASANRDRAHVIASELVRVMRSLGVEPNEELTAIAERRGA